MKSLIVKGKTALALGIPNLARVALYRAGVRCRLSPVRRLQAVLPAPPYFMPISSRRNVPVPVGRWRKQALLFGWWPLSLNGRAPDWHLNPFTGKRVPHPERGWWTIPDFDERVGDIKAIWELSRFDWVLVLVQQAVAGDCCALDQLNRWLGDWVEANPAYRGPNWKCGQEASIRVMHLAMAALIAGQTKAPSRSLLDLVEAHLRRIEPTLGYAIAQDNNHGTSEAAALFIGGSWLARCGRADGVRWERLGRRWLENRAARLIGSDGSFSQYSVNYHRMMLDTFSMVEVWRRHLKLAPFSEKLRARLAAATRWLFTLVDPITGDAPNIGANDGARLLPLTDTDYRDYRPSVQLAMALFANRRAYTEPGPWDVPLRWLGLSLPATAEKPPGSALFDEGGYAVLRRGTAMAVMRYPRFRFRPSHADALHLDLWVDGENHLRDSGTYSYADSDWLNYFSGTASHNTVQFDDRDQMPRLGRFLFGEWLRTRGLRPIEERADGVTCAASYRDSLGAWHRREVTLGDGFLRVRDEVGGFRRKAVLRWRLQPGSWRLQGHSVTNGHRVLTVVADVPVARCDLTCGWESRYYLQKTFVPVVEVEIRQPGVLITEYRW